MVRRVLAVALLAAALLGCDEKTPTQILVEVDADESVRPEIAQLRVTIRGGREVSALEPTDITDEIVMEPELSFPFHIAISPKFGDADRVVRLDFIALDAGGAVVGVQRGFERFAEGELREVLYVFLDDCVDDAPTCDPEETCNEGGCMPVVVDPPDGGARMDGGGLDAGPMPDAGPMLDGGWRRRDSGPTPDGGGPGTCDEMEPFVIGTEFGTGPVALATLGDGFLLAQATDSEIRTYRLGPHGYEIGDAGSIPFDAPLAIDAVGVGGTVHVAAVDSSRLRVYELRGVDWVPVVDRSSTAAALVSIASGGSGESVTVTNGLEGQVVIVSGGEDHYVGELSNQISVVAWAAGLDKYLVLMGDGTGQILMSGTDGLTIDTPEGITESGIPTGLVAVGGRDLTASWVDGASTATVFGDAILGGSWTTVRLPYLASGAMAASDLVTEDGVSGVARAVTNGSRIHFDMAWRRPPAAPFSMKTLPKTFVGVVPGVALTRNASQWLAAISEPSREVNVWPVCPP